METYENEQKNQYNTGDLQNQEMVSRTQQQQASYDDDGMISPKTGKINEDDEEMDDEIMIDEDEDMDVEELEEDNQGTGGGMTRESDMNRGTMSAS